MRHICNTLREKFVIPKDRRGTHTACDERMQKIYSNSNTAEWVWWAYILHMYIYIYLKSLKRRPPCRRRTKAGANRAPVQLLLSFFCYSTTIIYIGSRATGLYKNFFALYTDKGVSRKFAPRARSDILFLVRNFFFFH